MRIFQPLTLVLAGAIFSSGLTIAQELPQNQQDAAIPQAAAPADLVPASVTVPGEQDKRILGVLPNYRTADGTKDFIAMKPSGKIRIALKDSFDYPGFIVAAALSGIYQVEGQNPSFGQGAKGY